MNGSKSLIAGGLFALLIAAGSCGTDPVGQPNNGECAEPNPVTGECDTTSNNVANNSVANNGGSNNTAGSNNANNSDPWADDDGDGFIDRFDNCADAANPGQEDAEGDGVGDACDNCLDAANFDQEDLDANGVGDACENGEYYDPQRDDDGDGVADSVDNCGGLSNADQADADADGLGDACDNCPTVANYDQTDTDMDGGGDACSPTPVGMLCGEQESNFTIVTPNLFILLDESGSMGFSCSTCQNTYPYQDALAALNAMADDLADEARFGVGTYEGTSCGSSLDILLPMGTHTAAQMKASWPVCAGSNQANCYIPAGGTPTADGLKLVRTQNQLSEPGDSQDALRSKAVILITDGAPSACGSEHGGAQQGSVAEAGLLAAAGVPVYVVGFNYDANNLNEVATAGGTDAPPAGGDRFYTANNTNDLLNALRNIATQAISCSYTLNPVPPDPNKIWVAIDGMPLPNTAFTYDATTNTLTLDQASCAQLRSLPGGGANPPLKITYGCATECVPDTEVCDFLDNNCDGVIDEGCEGCSPEICDGIDNDCDDAIDEGCPNCVLDGETCETHADCCNGNCREDLGVCGPPCRPLNASCRSNTDCCSGTCAKQGGDVGVCIGG